MARTRSASSLPLRRGRTVLWLSALLGITLYLSRTLWLPSIGAFLVVTDPLEPAEMVLPLAGDLERVYYAAKLYKDGYARRLLLTNLPLDTQESRNAHLHQARAIASTVGVPGQDIEVVPEFARTTFGEAQKVRAVLEPMEVRSLIVVTSPWHTRRARLDFQTALQGSGIRVSMRPFFSGALPSPGERHPYRPRTWWHDEKTRRSVISEYLKLMAYTVGIR